MAVMFEAKNTELYNINEAFESEEPSTLTTFGTEAKDNLVVFEKRISAIMDGSSDDAWDDKVKTQINKSIDSIKDVIAKEEKAADFIVEAEPIVSNMKTAEGEYVLAYDSWEDHVARESTIEKTKQVEHKRKKKKKDDDSSTDSGSDQKAKDDDDEMETYYTTEYTDKYIEWLKEDDALRETVPIMEEQGDTWKTQVNNYFLAFDYSKNEIDTSIYKPITTPIVYFGDEYQKQYDKLENKEYKPVEAPEQAAEEEIQETQEDKEKAAKERQSEGIAKIADLLEPDGSVSDDNVDEVYERLRKAGYKDDEIAAIIGKVNEEAEKNKPPVEEEKETIKGASLETPEFYKDEDVVSRTTEKLYADDEPVVIGTKEKITLKDGRKFEIDRFSDEVSSETGDYRHDSVRYIEDGQTVRIELTSYRLSGEKETKYSTACTDYTYDGSTTTEHSTDIEYNSDGSYETYVTETVTDGNDFITSIKEVETTSDSSLVETTIRTKKRDDYFEEHKEIVDSSTGETVKTREYRYEYSTEAGASNKITNKETDYKNGTITVSEGYYSRDGKAGTETINVYDLDNNVISFEKQYKQDGQIRHEIYTYENGKPVNMHLLVERTDGTVLEESDTPMI